MTPSAPSFEPIRDIFTAMKVERLEGVPLSDVIGGGDPERVASEIISGLTKHIDLASQGSVLDVGCGCGRIAAALTQYLAPSTDYVGVDILPRLIEFCRKSITPRYPNFRFLLLDEGNFTYDAWRPKGGAVDLRKLYQAKPAGSVDLAISISLFSHLDYSAAEDLLKSMARMLADDGQAFVTTFIVDGEARQNIENGCTGFSFRHTTPSGKLAAEKDYDPTHAVGYTMDQVDELAGSAGLTRENWIRGYWSQGNVGESFQDALILRKRRSEKRPSAFRRLLPWWGG
jgi:SAM-dependent methyltransferase